MKISKSAVNAIIKDICGRKGLCYEWESIDEKIQDEIKKHWVSIISEAVEQLQSQRDAMLTVLKEIDECAEYWSEYGVPLGMHERIKAAIAKSEG